MNQIIFLISLYLLTLIGYFLGQTTKDEHKEIKKFVQISILILINIFYALLFYIFYNTNYVYIILLLYALGVTSLKKTILKDFHNILLLGIGFSLLSLKVEYLYYLILFIFALTLENSFKKINYKQSSYEIIILLIILFVFSIV